MKNEYDYFNEMKIDMSLYETEALTEKEVTEMTEKITGRKKSRKKYVAVLACAAVAAAVTGVAAAEGYLDGILKAFTTGHNYFYQMDPNTLHELPEELKGKLFDKNGNVLEKISDGDIDNLYDVNGSHLSEKELEKMFTDALGDKAKISLDSEAAEKSYSTLDEAQEVCDFDICIPSYIPEGYSFSRAYSYTDEEGNVSGYYMNMEYAGENGVIKIMERLINDETAFTASSDGEMEEVDINGAAAVIEDGRTLNFETDDGVAVGIFTKGCITKDELIKIAKSIEQ